MKKILIFIVFFLLSCSTTKYTVQVPKDEYLGVYISQIHNTDDISYLYGILDKKKIRIATQNKNLKKNKLYDLRLTSLRDLLTQYNAIPINFSDIDLSDFGVMINDSTYLKLQYKKYKDLYLTDDVSNMVIDVLNNIPMLKKK